MKTILFFSLFCFFSGSMYSQPDFGAIIEGPVLIEDTPGHIIMKSGDGSYWTLTVDGSGQLHTTAASFTSIDITISSGQTYTNNISVGDEEGVAIFQQAEHFNMSTIVMDASTNWESQYRYTPSNNFVGEDQVTLLIATGSNGASPNTHFEYLTIRFTVTQ